MCPKYFFIYYMVFEEKTQIQVLSFAQLFTNSSKNFGIFAKKLALKYILEISVVILCNITLFKVLYWKLSKNAKKRDAIRKGSPWGDFPRGTPLLV